MFGNHTKDRDVRLTEKQVRELKSNMSRSERKAFDRKQRQAESDRIWDAMIMSEIFRED